MSDPRRPTFMIIGAAKCGTTTLQRSMSGLSQVFMSTPKETQYFSHPVSASHPLDWYYRFFEDGVGHLHRGEASPQYTFFPSIRGAAERIHAMNPDLKLIYLARDPVERIRSAYAHNRRRGWETSSIETAIAERPLYLQSTRYRLQLDQYLQWFDRSQIHIETLENLRADHGGVLARVCQFLGVKADAPTASAQNQFEQRALRPTAARVLNAGLRHGLDRPLRLNRVAKMRILNYVPDQSDFEVPAELDRDLRRYFESDIVGLEALTGTSFDHWRSSSAGRPSPNPA